MRVIEPSLIRGPLRNPGIGFFAAPALEDPKNPILSGELFRFGEDSPVFNHPDSGVSFLSSRWAKVEKTEGEYDWSDIDRQLDLAGEKGRLCVFRCAPYALGDDDIPAWLRRRNPEKPDFPFWQIDPNRSDYALCWARFVREMARHLDGHPYLSSVDMALVGAWGEGGGTELMEMERLAPIIDAYADNFKSTQLQCLLHDPKSLGYIRSKNRPIGFRVDCLGDMGGFHGKRWSHMLDFYPQNIENFGMGSAWEKAPVVFEACWTMRDWFKNGWDIDYIIEESLKWHITSFNSKGCPVPAAWKSQVEYWVNRMGYRFELRRVIVPEDISPDEPLRFRTMWRNSGSAPCYHDFRIHYRLRGRDGRVWQLVSHTDLRQWLPGEDHLADDIFPSGGLPEGDYDLSIGIETGIPRFLPLSLGTQTGQDGYTGAGTLRVNRRG